MALLMIMAGAVTPSVRGAATTPAYLALGDDIAVGLGASDPPTGGYVPRLYAHLKGLPRYGTTGLELINRAVAGETSTSMRGSGRQLDQAKAILAERNQDANLSNNVELITLDIGAADFQVLAEGPCAVSPPPPECLFQLNTFLGTLDTNLKSILGALRQGAGAGTAIMVMTYFNPLAGSGNPAEATLDSVMGLVNDTIKSRTQEVGGIVVDMQPRWGPGLIVSATDPHPNDAGYQVIANAFIAALPALTGLTPTPTPTPTPSPTPTPGTGNTQQVSLVAGRCNPVASTYPDATPAAALADNISPPRPDDTMWQYLPAENRHRGWNRQAAAVSPAANDLTVVAFLSNVSICVSGAATFTRPRVG